MLVCVMQEMSSNNYINTILSNLPNSIYWKDLNGVYLGANINAVHMLGLTSVNDIVGKTDYDFTSKERADAFRKNDILVITEDKEICIEEKSLTKDGRKLIQLSTKKSIKNAKGSAIGIIGITIDITDLKKKEAMLLSKTKALTEALSEKKRFLNTLSHEICTPLHVITSIAHELHSNVDLFSKKEFTNFLSTLLQNSNRLTKLVTNLLEIAKNTQRKNTYCFKKKDIIITIHEAMSEFKHMIPISLKTNYKVAFVYIDELKISQVLRNIIDNAIKYGKNEPIAIELKKMKDQKSIMVQVKNHGIGVLEEERKKVFEPFFQGSHNRALSKGNGLGLSICKELIFAHKGSIWIDQDELGMTCVNFTIPYTKQ